MVDSFDADAAHNTIDVLDAMGFGIGMAWIVKSVDGSVVLELFSRRVDADGLARAYGALPMAIDGSVGLMPLPSIRLRPFADSGDVQKLRGVFHLEARAAVSLINSNVNGRVFEDVVLLRAPSAWS